MANVKYRLIINDNHDTKCYFQLFMPTWIITIKHNIQSHFSHVITHRSVTRSWESHHISALQGFVSSFTQCYAMSIPFVFSKYRSHLISIT